MMLLDSICMRGRKFFSSCSCLCNLSWFSYDVGLNLKKNSGTAL